VKSFVWRSLVFTLAVANLVGTLALAQDASIDRLLNKLPPPEKIVKPPPIQQAVQRSDPAVKDPLVRQVFQAELVRNFPQALNLSRKLTERYPRSAGAQSLRGVLAWRLRQFGEASAAFRTATNIQPKLAFAHFGLALVEASQRHFAAAVSHLQRVTELEPKAAVAYYALSDCTLRLGRKQESVDYARKATTPGAFQCFDVDPTREVRESTRTY
jgi:tetratricopeptide (TPR) repeat protein